MDLDGIVLNNKPNKTTNNLWLKSLKCWESFQNWQSLSNQIPQYDLSNLFETVQKELLSTLSYILEKNIIFDINSLNEQLKEIHNDSFNSYMIYIRNLMDFLNNYSENNPSDLFYGFQLNTINQIENDMKKINEFIEQSHIIKNPLTPKNIISKLKCNTDNIYDDHDFFQNIAGNFINKMEANKRISTKDSSQTQIDFSMRSHKDRIIDYRVHTKIRNFATPSKISNPVLEDIRDDTISHLFQTSKK